MREKFQIIKEDKTMIKKIIAYVLLGLAVVVATVLFTYGGPVLPHIIGPAVMAIIGAVLLFVPGKKKPEAGKK
jgi:membrane associated rhomboid family serine protease